MRTSRVARAGGRPTAVWARQARLALVIARKDAMIYYLKAPVITFGLVFPAFFFLAFAVGRAMPADALVPGMLAMALFFGASAVGPLITPWERQARTYERLATSPAALEAIVLGDLLAAAAFGAAVSMVPLGLGLGLTSAHVVAPGPLVAGVALGAVTFGALGVLLAARGTDAPSEVMMLSNLVRLPLIFVSGVFVPLADLPAWGWWVGALSPLSYCVDLVRLALGEPGVFPAWLSAGALAAFAAGFTALAALLHRRQRRLA
jgi:ABC-2 type transport system permease protein